MRSAKPLTLARAGIAGEASPMQGFDAHTRPVPAIANLVEETKDMPAKAHHTVISAILALSAVLGAGGLAKADQPPDHHGKVIIENVWATPAREGGQSMLRLRIINESHDHAHLIGIETPVAKGARIVGRTSDHETTTFDSMSVRADGEIDLTTDHIWIELGPLAREVKAGESIPLELIFVRSRVPAEAHVHPAEEWSPKTGKIGTVPTFSR